MRTTRKIRVTLFSGIFILLSLVGYGQSQVVGTTTTSGHEFLIYTNSSYASSSDDYPMIIYLHGASSINTASDDITILTQRNGPPKLIAQELNSPGDQGIWPDARPFVVVSPHMKYLGGNKFDQLWEVDQIKETYDYVVANYRIDTDRVYVTGISSGGRGVWNFVQAHPGLVAATIPISGTGAIEFVCDMADVPVWAFHGDQDMFVPYSGSNDGVHYGPVDLVDSINNCTPTPSIPAYLTPIETKRHDGWNEVYDMSSGFEIYDWMLSIDKGSTANIPPLVNAGPSSINLLRTDGPFMLNGMARDVDGSISTISWTQESGPSATLSETSTLNLRVTNPTSGTYTFRMTATDNDGASSFDEIQVEVFETATEHIVDELVLFRILDGDTSDIGPIYDGDVISYADIGTHDVFIRAEGSGWSDPTKNSMRFALNQNRNLWTLNDRDPDYIFSDFNSSDEFNDFVPPIGINYLTATPIDGTWGGPEGISRTIMVEFTEEAQTPQPVTFRKLDLSVQDDQIRINWETSYESNSSHFEVQKLNQNKEFMKIGETASMNNLTGAKYTFYDHEPITGTNVYRIKSIDFDGAIDYSRSKSIRFSTSNLIRVFPNPTSGILNIEFSNTSDHPVSIAIYDVVGNEIYSGGVEVSPVGNESVQYRIPIDPLVSGVYFLRFSEGTNIQIEKVIAR